MTLHHSDIQKHRTEFAYVKQKVKSKKQRKPRVHITMKSSLFTFPGGHPLRFFCLIVTEVLLPEVTDYGTRATDVE